jgi:hypothetical protein
MIVMSDKCAGYFYAGLIIGVVVVLIISWFIQQVDGDRDARTNFCHDTYGRDYFYDLASGRPTSVDACCMINETDGSYDCKYFDRKRLYP